MSKPKPRIWIHTTDLIPFYNSAFFCVYNVFPFLSFSRSFFRMALLILELY